MPSLTTPHCYRIFKEPQLSRFTSIPDIYDWNFHNNPDYPVFTYQNDQGRRLFASYGAVVPAAHKAAFHVSNTLGLDISADRGSYPTVALLTTADTVTTYTTLIGMLHLGLLVFPISPRFSPQVIAHLLEKSNATAVLVSDDWLHGLASNAIDILMNSGSKHRISGVFFLPQYTDLYESSSIIKFLPKKEMNTETPALLVHTSCSTSQYPKVIAWTVGMNFQQARGPATGTRELVGKVLGCFAIEPFHGIGLLLLFWMPSTGITMGTFRPRSPAVVPKPDAEWSTDNTKIDFLAKMQGVLSGGKAIRKAAGDLLASRGVSLRNMYGSTESGHLSAVPSPHLDRDWEYFTLHQQCKVEFDPIGDGSFHAIVLPSVTHDPPSLNTMFGENQAYATGDLFFPHPHKPGYWKFFGRMDARIMLSSGLVVNASHIEEHICEHEDILAAVVFGYARPRLGVIIHLKSDCPFAPEEAQLKRDKIWPHIEKMNKCNLAKYSCIAKEMIIFTQPGKPFPYSQKGAPRRPAVIIDYQAEIDALYGSPMLDPLFFRGASLKT
ncbi:hypothetical protein D9757_009922 [Collybiopsis confluens]|uniref:AMP-dependent synthetase/ligase domain-containing protein n=1 Tax=Collybiopsis confluens TaxID=2823264 RepID=A0A8H5GWT0_9AGAR|nr:hypothetical protein D9757_009922 [Collybiopsis confluens]